MPQAGAGDGGPSEQQAAAAQDLLLLVSVHHGFFDKPGGGRGEFAAAERQDRWRPVRLTALELLDHISAGKAWVACLLNGERTDAAAGASNLIVLDIDGDISLEDFWALPFVQRHCLYTATSCSHQKVTDKNPEALDRFRALFSCEEHEDIELHKAIYYQLLAAAGLKLVDNGGEKPERLWYGNSQAEVRFGGGAPLSWDLIDTARELAAADKSYAAERSSDVIDDQLIARCDYVLRHLLPPSAHGGGTTGYNDYWQVVLNAAASAGDALFDAFQQWSSMGDHGKEERINKRRWHGAGRSSNPAKLLKLAKEHLGGGWWNLLPEELRRTERDGNSPPKLTVLFSKRTEQDVAPDPFLYKSRGEQVKATPAAVPSAAMPPAAVPPAAVPDTVPSTEKLEQLKESAPRRLFETTSNPLIKPDETLQRHQELLDKLYHLRAYGLIKDKDKLTPATARMRHKLDRVLLAALLECKGYLNSAAQVEVDLLEIFRLEHDLYRDPTAPVMEFILDGFSKIQTSWLIPNFIIKGRDHMLYSKAGIGKTILSMHLVRALTGDPEACEFLDSGTFNNNYLWRRSRVLYIGTDMGDAALEMTNTYLQTTGMAGDEFLEQVTWWLSDPKGKRQGWQMCLKDLIKLHNYLEGMQHAGTPVSAVFIDSLKSVCPGHLLVGQQEFKDYYALVTDICQKYEAALIWIHHSRADGSGAQGIQRLTEAPSAIFQLKRDDKTHELSLVVEKIRGGARTRTLPIKIFGTAGPRLLSAPLSDGNISNDGNLPYQMILQALQEHFKLYRIQAIGQAPDRVERDYPGMSRQEITNYLADSKHSGAISTSVPTLQRFLQRMAKAGVVKSVPRGRSTRYRMLPQFSDLEPEQLSMADLEAGSDDLGPAHPFDD